ncbi:anti-sigma factor domain-containing protein [Metabacillus sp. RGM 3146]|uniref:anti-sigma factor domain-containing protein n=1 Tax=Metabacillus sp. RGM 3146 TaxID=3401092 RepID=UPI003B9C8929
MKRGVVVHLSDKYVTLLTSDGQFTKARNVEKKYQLGEEIAFSPQEFDKEVRTRKWLGISGVKSAKAGVLTIVAIILLFFTVLPILDQDKVYAYMTVDINPSFELALNEKMQVVKIHPINDDGKKLINNMPNMKHEGVRNVINQIVSKSKEMGYVKKGKKLLITAIFNHQGNKEYDKKLMKNVGSLKGSFQNEDLPLKIVKSDMKTREKARKQGISTGKYLELQVQPQINQPTEHKEKNEEKKKEDSLSPNSENSALKPQSNSKDEVKLKLLDAKRKLELTKQELKKKNGHSVLRSPEDQSEEKKMSISKRQKAVKEEDQHEISISAPNMKKGKKPEPKKEKGHSQNMLKGNHGSRSGQNKEYSTKSSVSRKNHAAKQEDKDSDRRRPPSNIKHEENRHTVSSTSRKTQPIKPVHKKEGSIKKSVKSKKKGHSSVLHKQSKQK